MSSNSNIEPSSKSAQELASKHRTARTLPGDGDLECGITRSVVATYPSLATFGNVAGMVGARAGRNVGRLSPGSGGGTTPVGLKALALSSILSVIDGIATDASSVMERYGLARR